MYIYRTDIYTIPFETLDICWQYVVDVMKLKGEIQKAALLGARGSFEKKISLISHTYRNLGIITDVFMMKNEKSVHKANARHYVASSRIRMSPFLLDQVEKSGSIDALLAG